MEGKRFEESTVCRFTVVRSSLMNILKMTGIDASSEIKITEIKYSSRDIASPYLPSERGSFPTE